MQDSHQDFLQAAAQLAAKLSAVAESINARNAQSTGQMQSSAAALGQKAREMQSASEDLVQQVISAIVGQAPAALAEGMGNAVGQYQKSIEDCESKAKWACEALSEQRRLLSRAQSARMWVGVTVLVLGGLVWMIGTGYVVWSKQQEITQLGYQEQVAKILQTQTVVPCGNGLCAKINKNAPHYGAHGEYVQITAL
jgi:hypothetical protein